MAVYLDASVIVSMLFKERMSAEVAYALRPLGADICVSDFAAAEVSAAVSKRFRMGLDSESGARARLHVFDAFRAELLQRIVLNPDDLATADRIVRSFELKLRAPDAIHAAVCLRLGAALATLDQSLAEAAALLGIEVVAITVGET